MSKYNVFDNLDVISLYVRSITAGQKKSAIRDVENPEYNAIELYFADFLIINSILYCTELPGELSLRKQNDRYKIFKPVDELNYEVHKMQLEKEPLVGFVSYMFNQTNMNMPGNALVRIYRYLYLYDSDGIKNVVQKKFGISLDYFFRAALYIYCCFSNGHFNYKEKDLLRTQFRKSDYILAIRRVLRDISLELANLRRLCKDYCSYESDRIFNYYNDAPHVRYPLIRSFDGYCCVVPDYIIAALLDGLYYALEIPNHPDIRQEFATNFENYVGMLLETALGGSNISFCREISYKVGKQGSQKTSDWILWDSDSICFLDCKLKRISIAGKRAVEVDDNLIKQIIDSQPFSTKNKHDIIEPLEEGLTKDLILLGIDLGKIYACYEEYKEGIIPGLYDVGKRQYACLVTLEDCYINTPEYKKRIVQIAQSYRDFRTGRHEIINEKDVLLLSVNQLERSLEMMTDMGVSKCLDNSPILDLKGHRRILDSLMEKFTERIYNPFMADIIQG